MRIVIFTSNAMRHKFLANALQSAASEVLVISECKEADGFIFSEKMSAIERHFYARYQTEKIFFKGNDFFCGNTLPILYKEANTPAVFEIVKKFNPEMAFVFGASLLKEKLLSLIPSGRFVNLHLGLSPYYRGSGTNFWPFVNKELEYIGGTILHIDSGIDTGDIICHVTPKIEVGDNVHTVGCKVIQESAKTMLKIMEIVKSGNELNRVKQWSVNTAKYYRASDFNEGALVKYQDNLTAGMILDYIANPKEIKLIKRLER